MATTREQILKKLAERRKQANKNTSRARRKPVVESTKGGNRRVVREEALELTKDHAQLVKTLRFVLRV